MGVLDDRRDCSVPPSCSLCPEDDEIHSCVRRVLAEGEQRHEEVPPAARAQQLLVPTRGGLPETGEQDVRGEVRGGPQGKDASHAVGVL